MPLFLLLPIIFASSLVLTMVGLGGGLIFSPLFILLYFPVPTALSASLFLNGIAAISAAITYFQKKMVDVHIGVPLIVSSTLAAPLGAYTSAKVDVKIFTAVLAGVILLAAGRMLFSGKLESEGEEISARRRIIGGGAIGVAIGFMAGLLGIGGGVFIVPLLIYLLKVPTKTAAATSIFIVVFSSFSGFATHVSMEKVDWHFILLAALFSFAGGQMGSRIMAARLKGKTVRRIFGVVLLLFAVKLVQRVLS
ncbi:MAG: sulfite exporter TauE/SafE family protein [Deltaproteobacteria bacterium]|nr:sulfite exporter TauE/SafE family protein [Deltaproteobacteria bacterium]MBW2070908.1 sulfite exporter TauE/SafE family protein [Deltaproteobacteria bacterium]